MAQAEAAGYPVVVKAQVKVGGRGKAGGVKLADDADEVRTHAGNILGLDIKGHVVKRLWIEHASDIAREYYASFTLDRSAKKHLGMLSAEGGVEIEEVAATDPEAIAMLHVDPVDGLTLEAARRWVDRGRPRRGGPGPGGRAPGQALHLLHRGRLRPGRDQPADPHPRRPGALPSTPRSPWTTTPPSATPSGRSSPASDVEDERETRAKERGLNYIGLDGSVGIIANGAGLAMSTLDVVNQCGGSAANFLDIGGGANADVMAAALEVINSDPAVRSIFVNIFGGITRVDEVANGVLEALDRVDISSPIVLRLDGTNAVAGREILADHLSDRLVAEPTMLDAARRAVALAGGQS